MSPHSVFFTHCNPSRLIIHKPSFSAALAHEQVPSYLLLAICANAAPLSKEHGVKSSPPRLAGVPFFQEAVSIMFDASGRLLAEPSLCTAQALCLLEMHEVAASHSWTKHYRYFGKNHPHPQISGAVRLMADYLSPVPSFCLDISPHVPCALYLPLLTPPRPRTADSRGESPNPETRPRTPYPSSLPWIPNRVYRKGMCQEVLLARTMYGLDQWYLYIPTAAAKKR